MTEKHKGFTLYLDPVVRRKIENCFFECRIKNFNEGYRTLVSLGFEEFKKSKKKGGKK
jgi:hypothetical protein